MASSSSAAHIQFGSIPPLSEWRRAPFFLDGFWESAEAYVPEVDPPQLPFLLSVPETPVADCDLTQPSSVHRLRLERGDYPFSPTSYTAHCKAPEFWTDWVDDVVGDADYAAALRRVRVLDAVILSAQLAMGRDIGLLDALISRWSSETHTFVHAWGESAPTLEDVNILLRLRLRGESAFDPAARNPLDTHKLEALRKEFSAAGRDGSRFDKKGNRLPKRSKTGKSSWGCYLRHFFKDIQPNHPIGAREEVAGPQYRSDIYLEAFLSFFLCFFVLPGYPFEGPRKDDAVFSLACGMVRGDRVPLAPLFLGSLYNRLDQLQRDMSRSVGRREVISAVHSNFLSLFLLERFPAYAPAPLVIEPTEMVGEPGEEVEVEVHLARAMRWDGKRPDFSIMKGFDDLDSFAPRPLQQLIPGIASPSNFPSGPPAVTFVAGGPHPVACFSETVTMIAPSYLPSLSEEGPRVVVYRPDRVVRQFGYDQGVPGPPPVPITFAESWMRYQRRGGLDLLVAPLRRLTLPFVSREGGFTSNNRLAWHRNLQ